MRALFAVFDSATMESMLQQAATDPLRFLMSLPDKRSASSKMNLSTQSEICTLEVFVSVPMDDSSLPALKTS